MHRLDHIGEGNVADHQQVHVAVSTFRLLRHRPEYQGKIDPIGKRRQCITKHVSQASGLPKDRRQVLEQRVGGLRLIADLVPRLAADQQPRLGQGRQLAMQRPSGDPRKPSNFPDIEALPGVQQQQRQDPAAVGAEQRLHGLGWPFDGGCSHIENKCSVYENNRQPDGSASPQNVRLSPCRCRSPARYSPWLETPRRSATVGAIAANCLRYLAPWG